MFLILAMAGSAMKRGDRKLEAECWVQVNPRDTFIGSRIKNKTHHHRYRVTCNSKTRLTGAVEQMRKAEDAGQGLDFRGKN